MNPNRHSTSKDLKVPMPFSSPNLSQADDKEYGEKMAMKDQSQPPPRFSTIFDTKAPTTPTREFESYPLQPTRRSGVYIPKPVFWAVFAIFLFESAVLFAYTVIGLINNISPTLIHTNSAGVVVAGCDCNSQPINVSPNFYMPQGPQVPVVETTTLSTSTSTTSTSTSTSSSSSSPSSSSSQSIDAGVSKLAEIMKSIGSSTTTTSESSTHTPNTHVVTVTPPQQTVKSTTILTVDPSGSTIAPRPTVTSTQFVAPDAASSTLETRDEPTSIVSTTTTSAPTLAPIIVPSTTKEGDSGILVSISMASVTSFPTISLTLKSHNELANKPTQESDAAPSSSTTLPISEPSETVSPSSTTTSESTPTPTPTCDKSKHMWGASGRVWGGFVCK
jgi:hypothetical protein